MNLRIHGIAAIATTLFASSAFAQTSNPEIEPNSQKSEATTADSGGSGMVPGDTIDGTTTGTTTTLASTVIGSVDMFRVKTAALPLGIYKHALTITTTGTAGHTGTLRGVNQTGTAGTASTGGTRGTADTSEQASSTASSPPRFNAWYGFGKMEEQYYRVQGGATTTAPYVSTLSTTTITPIVLPGAFESANPITVSTMGQTTADTMIFIFDGNYDAIPTCSNDDNGPAGAGLQSRLIRTFAPGTYYLAVATSSSSWSLVSPPDEDFITSLLEFPGSVQEDSAGTGTLDEDFQIIASNGTMNVTNQKPTGSGFDMTWHQFTVALNAAPFNDNCANASDVSAGGSFPLPIALCTNDGSATCDTGGATSKDAWYKLTTPAGPNTCGGMLLYLDTCGSVADTILSVYDACAGTELACNDNGLGCGPTDSRIVLGVAPATTVWIRLSDNGLGGATAVLNVRFGLANDDCALPVALPGPGLYCVDNTVGATTGTQGQAEAACLFFSGTAIPRDVWFTYTATANGTATVSTCGLIPTGPSSDSKIAIYAGAGCPSAAAIACNDDAGTGAGSPVACVAASLNSTIEFPVTCGTTYTIQIGMYQASTSSILGMFSLAEAGTACDTPFTVSCVGDGTETLCPCGLTGSAGRGCPNGDFASGAQLSSMGVASITGDTLVLKGFNGSAFSAGLYFQGSANNSPTGTAFGHGVVCMGGTTPRLEIVNPHDVNGASQTVGIIHNEGGIAAPGTYSYQWWYRDAVVVGTCSAPGSAFNFSNAITLTWAP